MAPAIAAAGGEILARFETDPSPNTFPLLPIRSSETVFVWFCRFADAGAYVAFLDALERCTDWRAAADADALRTLARRAEVLRLVPSPRSLLRYQKRSGRRSLRRREAARHASYNTS